MTDPVLVPARENVERIVSCRDWFEIVVAVNLVFEPIVGRLMKTELPGAQRSCGIEDAVTPLALASANADTERHRAATAELVRLSVLADPSHGDGNRVVLAGWPRQVDGGEHPGRRGAGPAVRRRGQRDDRRLPVPGAGLLPAGILLTGLGLVGVFRASYRLPTAGPGAGRVGRSGGGRDSAWMMRAGKPRPRSSWSASRGAGRGRRLPRPLLQDRAGRRSWTSTWPSSVNVAGPDIDTDTFLISMSFCTTGAS